MPMMTWSDSYTVNSTEIDNQHKKLFSLINDLHDAMSKGMGKESLGTTLAALVDYSKVHFADEERMLAKINYPGLAAQKTEHAAFVQRVFELQTQFRAGKVAMTITVMEFLKDWLTNHILKVDQKYASYLRK